MIASHLTVPEKQGQTVARHRHNVMTGIGVPIVGGIIGRFNAAFLCLRSAQWRAGEGGSNSRRAHAVRQPEPDRHPIGVGRRVSTRREQTIMTITPKGITPEIRPNQTSPAISEIRWVSEATATKRLRRHLATIGLQLVITRAGTNQRREWGEYAILDNQGVIHSKSVNLGCSLKAHGLLAADERIEYRWDRFWLHHVARRVTVQVDGQSCIYHEQVTRDYSTVKAAKKAGESIEDRTDLVLVSWDASRSTKGGTHDAGL